MNSENKDNDITSNEINQILGINGVSKYNAKVLLRQMLSLLNKYNH